MKLHIKDARDEDVPAMLDIYNDVQSTTNAIWSSQPRTEEIMLEYLRDLRDAGYSCLVGQMDNDQVLVGYAALGAWRSRDGYKYTAEVTVLLHRDHRRKGYAKELLQAIIAKATSDGLKNLIASISGDNSASLALFEKLGFKRVGVFEQVGWRNDTWLDLVQMQLKL